MHFNETDEAEVFLAVVETMCRYNIVETGVVVVGCGELVVRG